MADGLPHISQIPGPPQATYNSLAVHSIIKNFLNSTFLAIVFIFYQVYYIRKSLDKRIQLFGVDKYPLPLFFRRRFVCRYLRYGDVILTLFVFVGIDVIDTCPCTDASSKYRFIHFDDVLKMIFVGKAGIEPAGNTVSTRDTRATLLAFSRCAEISRSARGLIKMMPRPSRALNGSYITLTGFICDVYNVVCYSNAEALVPHCNTIFRFEH